MQTLKTRSQFLYVRGGRSWARPNLVVEARRRAVDGHIGFGLTASKKVGNAVARNRAKRRLREAARQLLPAHGLSGVDYVLIARTATPHAPWQALLDDLQNALIRLATEIDRPGASTRAQGRRAKTKGSKSSPDRSGAAGQIGARVGPKETS